MRKILTFSLILFLALAVQAKAAVTAVTILGVSSGCGAQGNSISVTFRTTSPADYNSIHYDILFSSATTATTSAYSTYLAGSMACTGDIGYYFYNLGTVTNTVVRTVSVPPSTYSGNIIVIAEEGSPSLVCTDTTNYTAFTNPCSPTPTFTPTFTKTITPTVTPTKTPTTTSTPTPTPTVTTTKTPTTTPTKTPTTTPTSTSTTTPTNTSTNTPTATPTVTPTNTPTNTPTAVASPFIAVVANTTPVLLVAAPSSAGYVEFLGFTVYNSGATSTAVYFVSGGVTIWQGQQDANLTTGPDNTIVNYPIYGLRGQAVSLFLGAATTSVVVNGTFKILP